MQYNNLVKDFVSRTQSNLDFIQNLEEMEIADAGSRDFTKDEFETPQVFEVTQLINSLLGLVVLPHETVIDLIPDQQLDTLFGDWPDLEVLQGEPQVQTLAVYSKLSKCCRSFQYPIFREKRTNQWY